MKCIAKKYFTNINDFLEQHTTLTKQQKNTHEI